MVALRSQEIELKLKRKLDAARPRPAPPEARVGAGDRFRIGGSASALPVLLHGRPAFEVWQDDKAAGGLTRVVESGPLYRVAEFPHAGAAVRWGLALRFALALCDLSAWDRCRLVWCPVAAAKLLTREFEGAVYVGPGVNP